MLFRKIRYTLIGNEKVSRYLKYAIGEIILVVIGILVALQVNNWNQERITRMNTRNLLVALESEVQQNKDQLQIVFSKHYENLEAGKKLMQLFGRPVDHLNQDSLFQLFNKFGENFTFDPNKGVLKSAVSTGQIGNIRNEELRSLLASFEDFAFDAGESALEFKEIRNNQFRPILFTYIGFSDAWHLRYSSIPASQFPQEMNEVFMNQTLESYTANLLVLRHESIEEEESLMASIDRMLVLLTEEKERLR